MIENYMERVLEVSKGNLYGIDVDELVRDIERFEGCVLSGDVDSDELISVCRGIVWGCNCRERVANINDMEMVRDLIDDWFYCGKLGTGYDYVEKVVEGHREGLSDADRKDLADWFRRMAEVLESK